MTALARAAARWVVPAAAWLPALVVVVVPIWLFLRASTGDSDALGGLFTEDTFDLVVRSVGFAAAVALGAALIAVPLAFLTTRTDLPGRRIWAVILALPLALPSYVGAFTLIAAFGAGGMVSEGFGIDKMPDFYGFWGATIALVLLGYPYVFLPVRAALLQADPTLEESARVLGRSPLGAFTSTTLPLIRPALVAGILLIALYALSDFGAVSMLQFDTFTRVIYTQNDSFDRPGAAALSLVLVAVTVLILASEMWLRRRRASLATRRGPRPGGPPLIPLGAWKVPALLFCALVATMALFVPVAVAIFWADSGGNTCDYCAPLSELVLHTVEIAAYTAVAAMFLVVAVARYATRGRGILAVLPDRMLYTGFALPGIVIALALVFFGTRTMPELYQTLPLLVLALLIRFLPQAADTLRPAMQRVPKTLEESARTLGDGPLRAFFRASAPLLVGSWLAGGVLVFLTAAKELPATLLMRPTGYDTLATELWDLTNEGFFGEAATRALAILGIGVLPMIILVAWTERRRA